MRSSSFLVASLGFSVYSVMSSPNSDFKNKEFYFFFNLDSFIFFLCAMARASRAIYNKSGESGHPILLLDLFEKRKCFHLYPIKFDIFHALFMPFIMFRYVCPIPTL